MPVGIVRSARLALTLVVVVACAGCWTQFRGGADHTGVQPLESTIGRAEVGRLGVAWSGHTGTAASEPVVADGIVYEGALDHKLYAFDAGGSGCPGTPGRCTARWTATLRAAAASTPAVADGVLFVTAGAAPT